jgi:Fanconi anemia group M protein
MASTDGDQQYVDHPMLSPSFIERRLYQLRLAGTAAEGHTLVCLPTGLGKTTVSLLVTARRLDEVGGKALFLAPTKPLVQQHADFYREALSMSEADIVVFTGDVSPDDRAALWEESTIVIATPQVIENDLVGGRISLRDVTHLTFDECHRATGDYAYNYIAERYHADASDPLVTGMSASPGGDEEEILEVCENLGIDDVEVMTEEDADVDEYTHETEVEWERIELPDEITDIRDALNEVIEDRLEKLRELGVTGKRSADLSENDLQSMRAELQKLMNNDQSEGYKGMSLHAEIRKVKTAVTYVETQSVEALERYFDRLRNAARSSGASKADQRLISDPRIRQAMKDVEAYDDIHPKFSRMHVLLAETLGIEQGERVIVFTESRDTAEILTEFLNENFDARRFVGQGDREGSDGMTQNEQQETLDAFRNAEFEVLVSTSVAEEGLDVPEVDLVLFYEPVPTAIRSIQRKGRTGRQDEGRVVVLLAEDTRDEAYFWISRRREQQMEDELRELKGVTDEIVEELDDSQQQLGDFDSSAETASADGGAVAASDSGNQPGLQEFADEDGEDDTEEDADTESVEDADDAVVATASSDDEQIEIVADQRELDANIARELSKRDDFRTRLETLAVGDYILSDRVAVERKTVDDFLDTLTGGDRSMFEQVGDAARHYSRPVVIIEGSDLYGKRDVHPNAIRGALSSLAVDFGASILQTEDEAETRELLAVIAGREQQKDDREVSVHGEKQSKTLAEQQEYVVAAIADIGPVTARSLLSEFGTVEAVMTAREEDLLEADGVGQVTAERIREVIGSEYTGM